MAQRIIFKCQNVTAKTAFPAADRLWRADVQQKRKAETAAAVLFALGKPAEGHAAPSAAAAVGELAAPSGAGAAEIIGQDAETRSPRHPLFVVRQPPHSSYEEWGFYNKIEGKNGFTIESARYASDFDRISSAKWRLFATRQIELQPYV